MVKSRLLVTTVPVIALTVALTLAGCRGGGPSGMYSDTTGRISIEFKNGKAYLNLGGAADTDGTAYDVKDGKINIHYPGDSILGAYSTMTINNDGSLQSPMGTLTKK
jgi:hypothetical protein